MVETKAARVGKMLGDLPAEVEQGSATNGILWKAAFVRRDKGHGLVLYGQTAAELYGKLDAIEEAHWFRQSTQ